MVNLRKVMKITGCPARDCNASELRQFPIDKYLLNEAGLTDVWTSQASKCSYCGVVYSIDSNNKKRVRGWFEGNTLYTAENWKPFNRANY